MQLKDLVKNIKNMTDEELQEHVRSIRHNKYIARPAASRRRVDERKKTTKPVERKIDKIINSLGVDARAALIKELEG